MLDLPYHKGIGQALKSFAIQSQKRPTDMVFSHKIDKLNQFLDNKSQELQLGSLGKMHAYRFRHGGASHDYHNKLRDLPAIQARGRWKSMASVRRYQKGARLAQLFAGLPDQVQRQAIVAAKGLPKLIANLP